MSTPQSTANQRSGELHFTFVELLFSLAVAEVAVKTAEFVDVLNSLGPAADQLWKFSPTAAHLALSLIVIAASWVGWGLSQSAADSSSFSSIFSKDFIELLLDVVIVVVYFILVHLADRWDPAKAIVIASCREELYCSVVIFALYFVWDLISKLFQPQSLLLRSWASLVCLIIALLLAAQLHGVVRVSGILLVDGSLCALFLLFRVFKLKDVSQLTWVNWLSATVLLMMVVALGYLSRVV